MAFEVHHNYFKAFEDVLDDIRQDGYWPTTFPPPGFSPDPWFVMSFLISTFGENGPGSWL